MAVEVTQAGKTLVGRTTELEAVLALVDEGVHGAAGALLLSGEAGVGKTTLLQESVSVAAASADVVWASCLPLSTLSVPFLPLISAVRSHSGDQGLLDPSDGSPGTTLTVFDGWLDRACAHRPVVLVVDDLQWADQSSLDVLLYVLAGPADRRLTVLMSVRRGEEGQFLPEWLANVRRLPHTRELRLDRLDRLGVQAQVTALLGQLPHASLVDQLCDKAAGNPYLTELLVRGLSADARFLPEGLPTDLHDAVARTWRRLSRDAKALTSLLSVAGRPQSGERLARLATSVGVEGDPVGLLREAVDAGVVERHGGRYWFGHPLMAEVLAQELLPEERQRLHASMARYLAATAGDEPDADVAVDLADHHAGAGHREDAFRWALTAATSVQRAGGAAEALRLLQRARALSAHLELSPRAEVEILERLADAAERCGDPDAAMEAVDRLVELADPHADPMRVAELLVRRIELGYETGLVSKSATVDTAEHAVRLSAAQPRSAQHATAVALLAESEVWAGVSTGSTRASEAVELATTSGSTKAMALALIARATATSLTGEGDALPDALAAEEAAAAAGDFRTYVDAVCAAGNAIDIGYTNPKEIEHATRSRERLVALGAPSRYVAWLSAGDAYSSLMSGDWRRCLELLRVALGSTPGPAVDCIGRLAAGLLDIRQGRWQQGAQHLARALELPGAPHEFFGYHAINAELQLARGDDRAALAAAMAGVEVGRANLIEHVLPLAARALANEARTLHDRGLDVAPALETLHDLRTRYPDVLFDVGPGTAHAAEIAAMQALYEAEVARAHQRSDSSSVWAGAAERCAEAGLAWDEAYARWRAAEAGLKSGSVTPSARDLLRRAHNMATDLEAVPLLEEIQVLAHQARIPLTAPAAAGPEDLPPFLGFTSRERDVLALVLVGRTYAEIAADLFISEKTVSTHISHMLRKTGTSSRIELAQLARRLSATTTAAPATP